jgi:hypothetical protein
MQQNPFSKTNISLVSQQVFGILWNLQIRYRVHKSPSFVFILSQMNAVHTNSSYFSELSCVGGYA